MVTDSPSHRRPNRLLTLHLGRLLVLLLMPMQTYLVPQVLLHLNCVPVRLPDRRSLPRIISCLIHKRHHHLDYTPGQPRPLRDRRSLHPILKARPTRPLPDRRPIRHRHPGIQLILLML